jgi:hypothetical protein
VDGIEGKCQGVKVTVSRDGEHFDRNCFETQVLGGSEPVEAIYQ